MSLQEAENEISRFTEEVTQYGLVKLRTIAETESIRSIWGEELIILFVESSASTLKYLAVGCKEQRDYSRARRMVNNLVVSRFLKAFLIVSSS